MLWQCEYHIEIWDLKFYRKKRTKSRWPDYVASGGLNYINSFLWLAEPNECSISPQELMINLWRGKYEKFEIEYVSASCGHQSPNSIPSSGKTFSK